jgi:hypothetical protein
MEALHHTLRSGDTASEEGSIPSSGLSKHTWNVNVPPRDGGDLPL